MLLNDLLFFLCIAPCLPQAEAILSRWELNVENEINVLNLNYTDYTVSLRIAGIKYKNPYWTYMTVPRK
jgi:hypothetical protein